MEPRIVLEAGALGMVAELASCGLAIAVIPESTANGAGLNTTVISDPEVRARLELVWKSGAETSPAAKALIQYAKEFWKDKRAMR